MSQRNTPEAWATPSPVYSSDDPDRILPDSIAFAEWGQMLFATDGVTLFVRFAFGWTKPARRAA